MTLRNVARTPLGAARHVRWKSHAAAGARAHEGAGPAPDASDTGGTDP